MCFGGKKSAPPPVPAPQQPTQFEYVNADTSNKQQRQAAIMSSTKTADPPTSFGSELGAAAPMAATEGAV